MWRAEDGSLAIQPMNQDTLLDGAIFSEDDALILTWGWDGIARLWHTHNGLPASQPMKHKNRIKGATFSRDGSILFTWSSDNTVGRWYTKNGLSAGEPLDQERSITTGATLNADKTLILTWGWGNAQLCDLNKGVRIIPPLQHDGGVDGAVLSSDESLILTWSSRTRGSDGFAYLWYSKDGSPAAPPMEHRGAIRGAVFSHDDSMVLTWSTDGTARLWHTNDGSPAARPMHHEDKVEGATFNKDKSLILTWSGETARLWDMSVDYDFPHEYIYLLVEVTTGTKMHDYGRVGALGTEEWLKKKEEYRKIADNHLKSCKYKKANIYLDQKAFWDRDRN